MLALALVALVFVIARGIDESWVGLDLADRATLAQTAVALVVLPLTLLGAALAVHQIRLAFPTQALKVEVVMARGPGSEPTGDPPEYFRGQPMSVGLELTCEGAIVRSWAAEFFFAEPELGFYASPGSEFPPSGSTGAVVPNATGLCGGAAPLASGWRHLLPKPDEQLGFIGTHSRVVVPSRGPLVD